MKEPFSTMLGECMPMFLVELKNCFFQSFNFRNKGKLKPLYSPRGIDPGLPP
jgi:hypothetical protein